MTVAVRTTKLKTRSVSGAEIARRAERMLAVLGQEGAELSVLLCDNTTIRRLNRVYRGMDRATDVLAFEQGETPGPTHLLGDVVISLPTARRQARAAGRSIIGEVTFLLSHGVLHLLGYDHQTPTEDRRMRAKMDVLCTAATGS